MSAPAPNEPAETFGTVFEAWSASCDCRPARIVISSDRVTCVHCGLLYLRRFVEATGRWVR